MIREVERVLNMTLIKCSMVGALYNGDDDINYLTSIANNITDFDLDRAYGYLLRNNSDGAITVYSILCVLAYINVSGLNSDPFLARDFGNFEATSKRFREDKAFAISMLRTYLNFYAKPDKPLFEDYAKDLGLYIGIDEAQERPKEEVITIDEMLIRAFDDVKFTLSSIDSGDKLASSIVDFIHYGSVAGDRQTKANMSFLNNNYELFLRVMYAKIFAGVLSGVVILDGDFQKEFDNHLVGKDYSATGAYEKKLLGYYIKARERESEIVLDEARTKLVRGIFALYR